VARSQRAFFAISALLFAASAAVTVVWSASMFGDGRNAHARRRGVLPWHVGRHDGDDAAAVSGANAIGGGW
jgi:hypothetical protein